MPSKKLRLACCFCGLVGMFLTKWLINQYVFPIYTDASPLVKECAVGGNALAFGLVAVAATWRRSWIVADRFLAGTVALLATGFALAAAGYGFGSLPVLLAGATLSDIGCGLVFLMICLACLDLRVGQIAVCVASSNLLVYLARSFLLRLPDEVGLALYLATPFVSLCLVAPAALQVMRGLSDGDAPAAIAVTRPAAFLPFGHQLFISLFVFQVVYGFAMTFNSFNEASAWISSAFALLAVLAVGSFFSRAVAHVDWLFVASVLLVLGGMLAYSVPDAGAAQLSRTLLSAGSGFFQVLAFFFLIALGRKNRSSSIVVLAWGSAVMSVGVMVGAALGRAAGQRYVDETGVALVTAVIVFAFVAAVLVLLRGFSVERTLAELEDASRAIVAPEPEGDASFDDRCRTIGEEHGLTQREQEIFVLLARGRNSPYIQEELTISYNTVRTHVRHIYEKCGFHTQQELIDAVELAHR